MLQFLVFAAFCQECQCQTGLTKLIVEAICHQFNVTMKPYQSNTKATHCEKKEIAGIRGWDFVIALIRNDLE